MAGWAYGWSDNTVWVHFYGSNTLKTKLPSGTVVDLVQQTDYPWQGQIKFTFQQGTASQAMAVRMRIPAWAEHASVK